MTNERRASLIKNIFLLVLVGAVVGGALKYKKHKIPPAEKVARTTVAPVEDPLEIVEYTMPGEPGSDQMWEILNKVQKKYGRLVIISRVDAKAYPEVARAAGVTKVPHIVISAAKHKEFEFQGLWAQSQVERKVDEILRGLKRVGADWRPAVPGMQPAGSSK